MRLFEKPKNESFLSYYILVTLAAHKLFTVDLRCSFIIKLLESLPTMKCHLLTKPISFLFQSIMEEDVLGSFG